MEKIYNILVSCKNISELKHQVNKINNLEPVYGVTFYNTTETFVMDEKPNYLMIFNIKNGESKRYEVKYLEKNSVLLTGFRELEN